MRRVMEESFGAEGILARATGDGGALPGSSLAAIHFPYREDTVLDAPDVVFDPNLCDVALGTHVLELALLLEDVHMLHCHGAATAAHSSADLVRLGDACRRVAQRVRRYRES
jgi:hypothetical protein